MKIIVRGIPGPQGSKKFVGFSGAGKALMIESSAKVKPWREAVKWAAVDACGENRMTPGAVRLDVTFTLPRPKSAKRGAVPSKKPDLSKLVRSTEDALTEIGCWEDDARVISTCSRKVYVGGVDALDSPGAVIIIERMES